MSKQLSVIRKKLVSFFRRSSVHHSLFTIHSQAGFTLVELLVVITIIGILTGLTSINLSSVRAKARDNKRQGDLATIAGALELFRSERKQYPPAGTNGAFTDAVTFLSGTDRLVPRYTNSIPKDPKFTQQYAFGKGYVYATNADTVDGQAETPGSLFALDAGLEQKQIDAPLDPSINPLANNTIAFFRSGFYADSNGLKHFRVANP